MAKSRSDAAPKPAVRLGWRRALALALVVAGLSAAYLSVELKSNNEPGFPLDDSWIHLTFARNLARGWGFAYNQGEPVAGSTAPLWTLILAFFHLLTRNATVMVVTAKLLGAALLFISAVFAFRIACLTTGEKWPGLAAGLAVATLGPMGWAMMSGMEVTLSVALTLAGIYYYVRFRSGWRSTPAWVLFGLAAWARPESLLLAAFAVLDSLLRRYALKQRLAFWRGFATWLAIVLAWLGFNYVLSRTLFPLTYAAKAGGASLFTAIAVGNLARLQELLTVSAPSYFTGFCVHLWRTNPVLCLLVPVGLAGLVASALRRGNETGFLIPLVVLGYVPLIGLVSPSFGAAFQSGRYIGNVTALAAVVAVIGVAYLWRWIRQPRLRIGVTATLLAAAVFNAVTVSVATVRNTTRAESSINRMEVTLGHWLANNAPAGATIACDDVGAIGYFSNRRIYDLHGLVTTELRGYEPGPAGIMAFLTNWKPTFLAIFPALYPGLKDAPFLEVATYADVPDNTASMIMFTPRTKTIAGFLILDIAVEPVPVALAVFKCNWDLLPPGAGVVR
jgi:arabinofuranosyltransferase